MKMDSCYACGRKFTNCILIPQRYLLGIMTSFATFTGYTMRVAINLAITEMVVRKNHTENGSDTCPIPEDQGHITVKNPDIVYDWSEAVQGNILSSFYYSYIITHLPGALIAERFGGKHVLGVGLLCNALMTIISPLVIKSTRGDPVVVTFLRVIMGFGQGAVYPVVTAMLAQWVPPKERGFMSSLGYSGALLGTVVTTTLGGILIRVVEDWDIIFYFFGALGLVWNLAWQIFCYSFPRTHPCLKEKEATYLEKELGQDVNKKKMKTPFKKILLSCHVWALIVAQFGHDWGWFVMVTDLPKYFSSILYFNIQENGLYTALPFFLMWISSLIVGEVADVLVKKNYLSIKNTRRIFGTLGQTGPAIFMILAPYMGCSKEYAVASFTLSLIFMGFYFSGIKVNAMDLSPNFAGTIMAFANGLGVIAGIVAPNLVGLMTPNQTRGEWISVFWLAFLWLVGTNVVYLIFMSAEVQPWNYAEEEDTEES